MYVLITFAVAFLIGGALCLFRPDLLSKADRWGQRTFIRIDQARLGTRVTIGLFLWVAAVLMIYFALVKRVTP